MADEKRERRTLQIGIGLTPKEMKKLQCMMEETGVSNRSDFIRQMIFDGYCVSINTLDIIRNEFWYCNDRLEIYSNAAQKKGSVYYSDIQVLRECIEEIGSSIKWLSRNIPKMPEPKHFSLYDW